MSLTADCAIVPVLTLGRCHLLGSKVVGLQGYKIKGQVLMGQLNLSMSYHNGGAVCACVTSATFAELMPDWIMHMLRQGTRQPGAMLGIITGSCHDGNIAHSFVQSHTHCAKQMVMQSDLLHKDESGLATTPPA